MNEEKPSARWGLRLGIAAAVMAAAVYGVLYLIRPIALVASASRGVAVRTVPGTVEVKAEFIMELKSEVGGRVRYTVLDPGKKVIKGDTLVQLDTGDVDLEIERYRNDLAAAKRKVEVGSTLKADVLNMRDTVANLEVRAKAGAYAQADLDMQKRLLEQMEQRMELDEVNLRLAVQTLENTLRAKEREKAKMAITAPADGTVTSVYARVGDLIGGNSPIASIIATTRTVEAKLSEENFAAVKVGQKASVRFLTYGADQYDARITKVLPSADPTTQRYTIFLDVALPDGRVLVPGLTGEVSIIIASRDNAIIIPRRALIGEHVLVATGGRIELRKIEKGYSGLNDVEVVKGVAEGELVVVEELDRFRNGDRVRTKQIQN